MPLGNYTSQFFANVYLSRFDHFAKHSLKAKHYVRYVDDFVILHNSKEQLRLWKTEIDSFLGEKLKLELHPQKTRIIPLSRGVDFVGFRNFLHHKLLRQRNVLGMRRKIDLFHESRIDFSSLTESYQGWQAYACWANTFNLREKMKREIIDSVLDKV